MPYWKLHLRSIPSAGLPLSFEWAVDQLISPSPPADKGSNIQMQPTVGRLNEAAFSFVVDYGQSLFGVR